MPMNRYSFSAQICAGSVLVLSIFARTVKRWGEGNVLFCMGFVQFCAESVETAGFQFCGSSPSAGAILKESQSHGLQVIAILCSAPTHFA
jgi:hypothetical protein